MMMTMIAIFLVGVAVFVVAAVYNLLVNKLKCIFEFRRYSNKSTDFSKVSAFLS